MNFEINPGIIISKINLKEDDTVLVTIDLDKYDLDEAYHIFKLMVNFFPDNKVITTFNGIEVTNENKK